VPGAAPLYSLSVAWVSICEALAPKRVLLRSLALFCLLPSYFQASENSVNKGVQRSLFQLLEKNQIKTMFVTNT